MPMQDDFKAPTGSVKPMPKLKPIPPLTKFSELNVSFETPEQVSAREASVASPIVSDHLLPATTPQRGSGHHWFNLPWPPNKQEVILASVVLAMAVFTISGYALLNKPQTTKTATPATVIQKPVAIPKPTTVPAALSGLQVAPEVNQRPVIGVMIENSQAARPQSGLSQAGVIFEAIAEGGITRFLALYQDQHPGNIGPIRSARPYYVSWNESFRAAYVHAGGSQNALANIREWGVQDINEFKGGPFRREATRPAPHNLYSNVADLHNVAVQRGYKSDYVALERKKAAPLAQPSAGTIDVSISSALYNSQFVYDKPTNTYLRSEGGAPQIDANTSKQLAPSVVITMVVPLGVTGRTSQGGAYSDYNTLGSGQALIFQDGGVTIGSWNKAAVAAPLSFTDSTGASVKLNPGQTWLTAVSAAPKVTYR